MKREIDFPYGDTTIKFHIPEANLTGVYRPQAVAACTDPEADIERALTHPLDTPPLSKIVQPGERVVVLVDDHTRATPAARILPLLLDELHTGGLRDEDVTILITHGTHRLSSDEEVQQKVGKDIYGRFHILQHLCTDEQNQVYVGLTSRATPVWINRQIVEADRCISIGHIGPNPNAGYSGGYKAIVPGSASLDTINANHSLVPMGFRQPGNVNVPCRLDIEEGGSLVKLDLVVNVVLCQNEQIAAVFAGTPSRVFKEGLRLAKRVYEVPCSNKIDIAITSGYPYDINLYQASRAIEYADTVVRKGGSILLVTGCPDGLGGDEIYQLMADQTKKPDDYLRDIVRRNGGTAFAVLGYSLARIKTEKKLHIITEGIPDAELKAMGFKHPDSLQVGVNSMLKEYGPQARVAVFPMGASTVPSTKESQNSQT